MQSEKNSAAIISAKAAEGAEHEANGAAILSAKAASKAAAVSCKTILFFIDHFDPPFIIFAKDESKTAAKAAAKAAAKEAAKDAAEAAEVSDKTCALFLLT